ncbi:MAG: AAA family ATPase, partial [Saprospiraceae bacterium]|nr:AAA family ATPase [Saprospiraceae bacterium]
IEILVKEMSNGPGDMAVIVAGYPREMRHFLDSNPGLKSRFKLYFEFDDYLPQELSEIGRYAAGNKIVEFTTDAYEKVEEMILDAYRSRDRSFGNARYVHDIIEQAKIQLGLRVMGHENPRDLDKKEISVIELKDVEKIRLRPSKGLPEIPVDQGLLDKALGELNSLIGLHKVKETIHEMVELVKYYQLSKKNVLNSFYLHTVFIGNPGTGKTTVARILTNIYKALGILERGHMVETDRQGLGAGFVGQTAIKTAEKIEESIGGVLFIDEAYALTQAGARGAHGDFGNEAIQTLLKRMEDLRGQFFVFVAGYPDNMESFLKANPGLNSRFDKVLRFEDYQPAELMEIGVIMLKDKGYTLNKESYDHLNKYFHFLFGYRDKYFGNARTVRSIVADVIKNQNLRLAGLSPEGRDLEDMYLIKMVDVDYLKLSKEGFIFNKKGIGFRSSKGS